MKTYCPNRVIVLSAVVLAAAWGEGRAFDSFEEGKYSSWAVSVEYVGSLPQYYVEEAPGTFTPTNYPFAPLSNPYIAADIGFKSDLSAPHGTHYLELTVGGGSTGHHAELRPFQGIDGTTYQFLDRFYRVTLSRDLYIDAENTLSLWANFYTEDDPFFDADDLRVNLNGIDIFERSVADVSHGEPGGVESGWVNVLWTAPTSSVFTLSLSSFQDNQAFSAARFDDISVLPEPGVIGLFLAGWVLLARRMRYGPGRTG